MLDCYNCGRIGIADAFGRRMLAQDPEISTTISQYELAYRMQTSVPGLMDLSSEPEHIHKLYGTKPGESTFAGNCLLARRMVERGVRFVQVCHRNWDFHADVVHGAPAAFRRGPPGDPHGGDTQCNQRLGGLLKYYARAA